MEGKNESIGKYIENQKKKKNTNARQENIINDESLNLSLNSNQDIIITNKSKNLNSSNETIFKDKDKIEQAASVIQNILVNSEFVKFTKSDNLDKGGKSFKMDIIDKKLLQKLDNKEKLSLKDLNKLKRIYYQNEDYEIEDALKEGNKDPKCKTKFTVRDIIYGLILMRREELRKEIESKVNQDKVKEEIVTNIKEINETIEIPEEQENEVNENPNIVDKEDITKVILKIQSNNNTFKEEFLTAKKKDLNLFNTVEEKVEQFGKESKKLKKKMVESKPNKIIEEDINMGEENEGKNKEQEIILTKKDISKEINQIKKNKNALDKEFFDRCADTRFELGKNISSMISQIAQNNWSNNGYWADVIRQIEKDPKKKGIPIQEQNMKSMMLKICEDFKGYTDMIGPLNELLYAFMEKANPKDYSGTDIQQLNILNVIIAMNNKINGMINILNSIWQYLLNDYKTEKKVAFLGDRGSNLNKSSIITREKKEIYATNNVFVPQDQWNLLPKQKKILYRFKFKDFNQLPNAKIWNAFNKDEKIEFLNESIKFRIRRSEELIKEYEDGNKKNDTLQVISKINSFLYYNCKDSKGYNCYVEPEVWKVINEECKNDEAKYNEHRERIDILTDILKTHSDNNRVIGIYFVKGHKVKCNGKSFEDIIINNKSSNNVSYPKGKNHEYKVNNGFLPKNQKPPFRNNRYNYKINSRNNHNKQTRNYRKWNNSKDVNNYKKKYEELLLKMQSQTSENILNQHKKEEEVKKQFQKPNF